MYANIYNLRQSRALLLCDAPHSCSNKRKTKVKTNIFFQSFSSIFFFCSTFKCDINAKVFCLWVFFCFLVSFLSRYLECQCNRTANENLTKKIKLKFVQFFNFLSVIFCLFVSSICFCQFLCTILKFFSSFRIFFNCRSLVIWCVWHLLDIRSLVIWISAFRSYFVKRWFPFCFGTSVQLMLTNNEYVWESVRSIGENK